MIRRERGWRWSTKRDVLWKQEGYEWGKQKAANQMGATVWQCENEIGEEWKFVLSQLSTLPWLKPASSPLVLKQCWGTTFSMETCSQRSVFSGLSSHTVHTLTEHMCQQEAFNIHVIIMMNSFNHQFSLDVSMKMHQLHVECKWRLTCYNVITSKSSRVYL